MLLCRKNDAIDDDHADDEVGDDEVGHNDHGDIVELLTINHNHKNINQFLLHTQRHSTNFHPKLNN